MSNRWILLALGIGFVAGGRYAFYRAQTRHRRATKHVELARWESEGGAVPITPRRTAQQVSPANNGASTAV